ncbi:hypothetical protein ABIB66_005458 [Bradyrhizobium sp. F1.13.3]
MIGVAEQNSGSTRSSLFASCDVAQRHTVFEDWFKSPDGRKEKAALVSTSGQITPLRITVAPAFDTEESRSGAIITIVPMAEELVRAELQEVLSVPGYEPEELVLGVMRAARKLIPYDLATFGAYTDDTQYHKTLVITPTPEWKWTTAWFALGEKVRTFLLSDRTWGTIFNTTAVDLTPGIDEDLVLQILVKAGMKATSPCRLNRPGFAGGHLVKLSCHGRLFQHGVVALLGFVRRDVSDGLQEPSVVEPVDHSRVANSTASKLRHGPRRWITLAL